MRVYPTQEDVMKMVRWIALLALAAVAFAALPAGAQAAGSGTELRATLHGSAAFPRADGKARFRDRGGQQELEVEVEDANRLAGTRLRVFVGGKQVARCGSTGSATARST